MTTASSTSSAHEKGFIFMFNGLGGKFAVFDAARSRSYANLVYWFCFLIVVFFGRSRFKHQCRVRSSAGLHWPVRAVCGGESALSETKETTTPVLVSNIPE
jgi:hypothetical protein